MGQAASTQQRAQAASARGQHELAARLLRRALHDGKALSREERTRALISLALAEAELGGLDSGLRVLDDALAEVSSDEVRLQALLHGQRGVLLLRSGQYRRSWPELNAAAGGLEADDPERIKVLINRGVVALRVTQLDQAATDFSTSLELARHQGLSFEEAVSVTNLGYLAFVRGDLPQALRMTETAQEILAPQSAWLAGVCARGRADVLLAAGLLGEAEGEYRHAVDKLTKQGHRQDRGQAALGLAEIERLRRNYPSARAWARRAARLFDSRGSSGWALLADLELVWIESLARPQLAVQLAGDLETRLAGHGLREEASLARLLRIGSLIAIGRIGEAEAVAGQRDSGRRGTRMATRMLAYEVRAQLHAAAGNANRAQRTRQRGLADLHRYQAQFGSVDLLTAASRIGITLATDGLRRALAGGRAASVLQWSEQVRATSVRMPNVRPPQDPRTAELLASLRYVQSSQRTSQLLSEPVDADLARQARDLTRQIREHTWNTAAHRRIERPVQLGQLRAQLDDGAIVLSLMGVDEQVHGFVVTANRTRQMVVVDDLPSVRNTIWRLRADLDQLARARLPARMRQSVAGSAAHGLRRLDALVGSALADLDTGGPLILVPSGQAALVPWQLVPRLRDRLVCVVPSLTWWVHQRESGPLPAGGREVHVAGPDVDRAEPEARAAAGGQPDARVLAGEDATVAATLAAMDGAATLHVAAHGLHEADNPLFSRLLLADGWLYGHDLDSVSQLPQHAVLSACETGMSSIRPGDEALGLTAALLHGGCRCVVSAVAKVNDDVAEHVAVEHHRALRTGAQPARALQTALAGLEPEQAAPLVCFGMGW